MRLRFNLDEPSDRKRSGLDAELSWPTGPVPFELKSTTKTSIATVRDFGPHYAAKWAPLHWLFAFYEPDEKTLRYSYYASPADMAPWIAGRLEYVLPDVVLAERLPALLTDADVTAVLGNGTSFTAADARRIMKNQWSAEEYKSNADLAGGLYSRAAMLLLLRERTRYVFERGATLNNPHIPEAYLREHTTRIDDNHASEVRRLVGEYMKTLP